ncbi:MAG: RHS repeat-associated core domain-containing protein [Bacteroidia bacterium]|nr:RHS repeat-associated core domain-containing protein [Bacteroidia bacterium]
MNSSFRHTAGTTILKEQTASVGRGSYYAFGSLMPGRSYNSNTARYLFNGKESDGEVYGSDGTSYDYGFRIYNPRLGRFLSVDPLTKKYPHLTPYQFASNRPIDGVDLDGLEWSKSTNLATGETTYTIKLKVVNSSSLTKEQIAEHVSNIHAYLKYDVEHAGANSTVNIEYEIIDVQDVDWENDFIMEFRDRVLDDGEEHDGWTQKFGDTQSNWMQISVGGDRDAEFIANTGAHELGHTAGLPHETGGHDRKIDLWKSQRLIRQKMLDQYREHGKKNLMISAGGENGLFKEQVKEFNKFIPWFKKGASYKPDKGEKEANSTRSQNDSRNDK